MKILVLQLARLGDIYMTWPVLRALQRAHPQAKIDLMTRPRFDAATKGLEVVHQHLALPTQDLLAPLLQEEPQIEQSVRQTSAFIDQLKAESYDWIINFSFSPASSYLVHAISEAKTKITGYTRHADGYLCIPDEVSSYFYAQVGTERTNRIHLCDIMATMVGVEIQEQDWLSPELGCADFQLPDQYIVAHIGASESAKCLSPFKWARIIKNFSDRNKDYKVVLVGGGTETHLSAEIQANIPSLSLIDLVGKTRIEDLFAILKGAALLVGGDSAPMHMASFTKTPCLNMSTSAVNFWETGPRSPKSFIYRINDADDVISDQVAEAMDSIIKSGFAYNLIRGQVGIPSYVADAGIVKNQFAWDLTCAIYMGAPFPVTDDLQFCEAIEKLNEINNVAIEQIEGIPRLGIKKVAPFLDRVDEVMEAIAKVVPDTEIIIRWFKTERLRIAPGTQEVIMKETLSVHRALKSILKVYLIDETQIEEGSGHG